MSGETAGPVIGGAGLVAFVGAVVAVKVGAFDTLVAAAAPGVGVVAVVAVAVLAMAGRGGGGSRTLSAPRAAGAAFSAAPRRAQGRCACGYTTYGERQMIRHEKGHANACRRAGGGRSTVEVWRNPDGSWSGLTTYGNWRKVAKLSPERRIAILAAGVAAAPSTSSPTDEPHIREILAELPADQRGAVEREGRRLARRWRHG